MKRSRGRSQPHPGADPGCRSCNGFGFLVVPDGEVARTTACDCRQPCPLCRGTGFVARDEGFRAPRARCLCQTFAARASALDAVGIPARHAASTRASFVPQDNHQTAVLGAVSQFLGSYADASGEHRGLVLHGDVGRGKTHLLVALLRELVVDHGVRARFVEFSHLLSDLKSGFDRGQGTAALIDPLVEVDVLGIDELGKGRATDFEATVIDEIVSRRYNAMRPVLATTNFAPGERTGNARPSAAGAQLGIERAPTLRDRVGDRVYSRLRETCDFVPVRGDDYRERRRRGRGRV
jgi:DNA replication protein DnaC